MKQKLLDCLPGRIYDAFRIRAGHANFKKMGAPARDLAGYHTDFDRYSEQMTARCAIGSYSERKSAIKGATNSGAVRMATWP